MICKSCGYDNSKEIGTKEIETVKRRLTRLLDILTYCQDFMKDRDYLPSYKRILEYTGYSSVKGEYRLIGSLLAKE